MRYHSLGNMLYVKKQSDVAMPFYELFILEQNNDTFWKLEGNKNDEFWKVTRS